MYSDHVDTQTYPMIGVSDITEDYSEMGTNNRITGIGDLWNARIIDYMDRAEQSESLTLDDRHGLMGRMGRC